MRAARPALLACVLAAAGCGGRTTEPAASPAPLATAHAHPRPAATVVPIAVLGKRSVRDPFRLTQLRDGRMLYTLYADAMHGHYAGRDTGTSDLVNPHITFVASNGKRLVAVAPAGTVIEKDKTVRMNGGVHARSQDGMTLASDTLRYDDQTEIVHGEGHVVVTFPSGERLSGDSVDWNLRTRDIDMNTGTR